MKDVCEREGEDAVVSFIDMMLIDASVIDVMHAQHATLFPGDMLKFYAKHIQRQPCPSRNLAVFFFRALVLLLYSLNTEELRAL